MPGRTIDEADLGLRLLDPVLTDEVEPRGDRRADSLRRDRLGDCDDPNPSRIPLGARGSGTDTP
jgi:hypothetical protein